MELMMVVVIIGILSSIAAVKISGMIRRAKDGETKANLGAIRTAVNIYYSNVLIKPSDLSALTEGSTYLKTLPKAEVDPYHQGSAAVSAGGGAAGIDDSGGWAYNDDPSDANFGKVWVNCTHTDYGGSTWTSY